jgi:DNA-binding transcriptional ArsR family regulator
MPDLAQAPGPSDLSAVFVALSDERRREMLARLARQPMTVTELAGPVGMRLPSAVKHLAVLESGGMVVSRKVGRTRTYQIRPDALEAIACWVEERRAAMHAAFDRLDRAIAEFPEEDNE